MAEFYRDIIKIEGGYTNDAKDHGGVTKYGISQRQYPNLNIKNLTIDDALTIYKRDYWDKYDLNLINYQSLADLIFILIVNVGGETGVRIVQSAIARRGMKLNVDGIMGKITMSALNMCNPFSLSESIRVAECQHYLSIVDKDRSQEIFFRGWIRRALM